MERVAWIKRVSAPWFSTGANGYSGGTTLGGGILSVASDSNLGATSGGIILAGGELADQCGWL